MIYKKGYKYKKSKGKFKPTKEDFDNAFELKELGATNAELAEFFGINLATYDKHKTVFIYQFVLRRRRKDREAIKQGKKVLRGRTSHKRTIAQEKDIIMLAGLGRGVTETARLIGMPLSTLRYWLETDLVLKHKVETAKENVDLKVLESLNSLTNGRAKERTRQKVETRDRRGNLLNTVTTTTEKIPRPSLNAIKLWLVHRENWRLNTDMTNLDSLSIDEDKVEYDIREKLYTEGENNE